MTTMGSARVRQTVRRLQEAIQSGRWPVNSQIPTEADLAAELGVGRSTLREAVRSLAHVGMLEPAPGRGTFVRSLNPVRGVLTQYAAEHSWSDILTVRRALEVQAAVILATSADVESVQRLREAHCADVGDIGRTERGHSPGQFHALLVELTGNDLLAELYSAVMGTLRTGLSNGALESGQGAAERRADHEALLTAIATHNPVAAAMLTGAHADRDVTVRSADPT